MVKYCPRCGTPNDDNALFCVKCGYQFPQQQLQSQLTSPLYKDQHLTKLSKTSKKKWILIGAVIVVIIIILSAITFNVLISSTSFTVSISAPNTIILSSKLPLSATISGYGKQPFSYQWYIDNSPIPGATSSNYVFYPSVAGTYSIYVNVTDSSGKTVQSNILTIQVLPYYITITAVDLTIQYTGLTSGYLGPTSQSLQGFNDTIFVLNSTEIYSITFTSSAILLSHSINSIYVNTPGFAIVSVSPNLPYGFSPGSTFTITITLAVPSSIYIGVLNLVVSTS
jgi:hypothetical protein